MVEVGWGPLTLTAQREGLYKFHTLTDHGGADVPQQHLGLWILLLQLRHPGLERGVDGAHLGVMGE